MVEHLLRVLGVTKMEIPKKTTRELYQTLYLKKSTWELIRLAHGWEGRGSVAKFAAELGVTRQYASGLVTNAFGCSTNVMVRIKNLLGIREGECFCHLFHIIKEHNISPNHPLYNQGKFMGEIPYRQYSTSADMRKLDYPTETEESTLGGAKKG